MPERIVKAVQMRRPELSPGDIVVWLPERKLAISGDMAFHERLLPVFEETDTAGTEAVRQTLAADAGREGGHSAKLVCTEITGTSGQIVRASRRWGSASSGRP